MIQTPASNDDTAESLRVISTSKRPWLTFAAFALDRLSRSRWHVSFGVLAVGHAAISLIAR